MILFLDIDGVLNNRHTFAVTQHDAPLDKDMVRMLSEWLEKHPCKVVLSSSWRVLGLPSTNRALRGAGATFLIEERTANPSFLTRGMEIINKLDELRKSLCECIILEDEPDWPMGRTLGLRTVKTSFDEGLTPAHIHQMTDLYRMWQEQVTD